LNEDSRRRVVQGLLALLLLALVCHAWYIERELRALRAVSLPHDLKRLMAWKQYYLAKTWHAAQSTDRYAARWYLQQSQRLTRQLVEDGLEDGNGPAGVLAQTIMLPRYGPAFDALEGDDVPARLQALRDVAQACNACHAATRHAFIRIEPGASLPWPQRFGAVSEIVPDGRR
jgi:hypothetical protein